MRRVAFVGVTTNIFLICLICRRKGPFQTGRESRAATTAQTGIFNNLNNIFRFILRQAFAESCITVESYVFINVFRIDNTAVAKSNTMLFFIKVGLIKRFNVVIFNRLAVKQALYDTTFEKVFVNNFFNIFRFYAGVETAFRIYNHNRAQSAKAKAARSDYVYFFCEADGFNFLFQLIDNLLRAGGSTAGTTAYEYMRTIH